MTSEEKVTALGNLFNSTGWKEVVLPALELAIKNMEMHWINGTRPTGGETISDDVIKGRIWALVWMRGWEERRANLVHNLEAAQRAQNQETVSEGGGSPYSM